MHIHLKSIKQTYLFGTTLTVFLNNTECAWLGNGEETTIDAAEGINTITITDSLRKREIKFEAQKDVTITLKRNRLLGSIESLIHGPDVKIL
jgi:hypothetical protein